MTTEEKIIQANKDYEEAKRLLHKSYAERFENLPVSECGEVYAQDVLALNEWAENESKRILNEWVNKIALIKERRLICQTWKSNRQLSTSTAGSNVWHWQVKIISLPSTTVI